MKSIIYLFNETDADEMGRAFLKGGLIGIIKKNEENIHNTGRNIVLATAGATGLAGGLLLNKLRKKKDKKE